MFIIERDLRINYRSYTQYIIYFLDAWYYSYYLYVGGSGYETRRYMRHSSGP